MCGNRARDLRHIEDALAFFLYEQFFKLVPDVLSAFGGPLQERFISFVRPVVLLDEVTDFDPSLPMAVLEAFPLRQPAPPLADGFVDQSCSHRDLLVQASRP